MRILLRLVAMLVVLPVLLAGPATAALQRFTPLQLQILHAVMQQNGYVDEALHARFWKEMSPEAKRNLMAGSIDGTIRATVGVGMDLERETWRSVEASLGKHQLSYTTAYLLLLKQLTQQFAGRSNPFATAIAASKRLIAAAADGTAGPDGKPITTAQVEAQLAAIDATYLRIYALLSPVFPPPDRDWPLDAAGAHVSWPFPFAMSRELAPAAGKSKVPGVVYDLGLNPTDFVALQVLQFNHPLDREALMLQGRVNLRRLGITEPDGRFAPFRGHDSVLAFGSALVANGKSYVSARLVQARDDNRLLVFIANAAAGPDAADALREKLEDATTLDEGF